MRGKWFHISLGFIISGVLFLCSCNDDKGTNSLAPNLELIAENRIVNLEMNYDSLIQFRFFYEDVDGDIGLDEGDTLGDFAFGRPNFYNFFCYLYALENDTWVTVVNPFNTSENMSFHERFPNLTPSGSDKRLSGELELNIPARPNGLLLDTVRFEMQLVDRSLHKSNICSSKEIILKHP